jgi:tetratricopeptide (TPR) repeat protein
MILESEDYQEPCCPFEKPAPGIRQRGNCKRIDLAAVIGECDRLFNSNDPQALGEHLRYWRKQAAQAGDLESELSILNELMGHYRMQGDRERGLSAVDDGIKLIKILNIAGTVSCGTILINAATALLSFGENDRAQRYYSEAARCYSDNLDPADARFAGLFNNMAAAHLAQGETRHAEVYYRKALEILQKCSNKMDAAVTFVNLAQLYYQLDESAECINSELDRAMELFNDPAAVHDGYYAHTAQKCAPAFGFFGRETDEEVLMQRAKEFYENA